jgi:hypothetical protein
MNHGSPCQQPTFGYLSAWEWPQRGYFGGYLIVSLLGRPLEFHCTAPVQPSRAQQILYGPTLTPFLLGEQIAAALLREAKLLPRLVLTDQRSVLGLRPKCPVPIVCLLPEAGEAAIGLRFAVAQREFELADGFDSDQAEASELLTQLAERIDLAEPFGRIHEAIREAHRIDDRGQDAHAHVAA